MNNQEHLHFLIRVAELYYLEGLNQQEIAAKFRVSRATISRAIQQARELGIIKIEINGYKEDFLDLERELESRFGLREAILVPSSDSIEQLFKNIGKAVAGYLLRIVRPGDIIGVSWGRTLRAAIEALKETHVSRRNITAVPLVGGVGETNLEVHSNSLAMELANIFGGTWHALHAPALVSSAAVCQALLEDSSIHEVLEKGKKADIALVGIGATVESSTMIDTGYFTLQEIEALKLKGAVGDTCSRFFDLEGNSCAPELEKRTIGISLEDLKKIPIVIGVAGGSNKVKSIWGALKGRLINVLVTDERTAREVLDIGRRGLFRCHGRI
ncbi:DNA-binding transcriptional regulator LsrR, DeoR family [Thermanaeromonas toyohensis ToBE]|uniref:DNA-binding transcriptional regulator LsrR, DeoR family n=1 Tax=Thermanaeromonas toyohensis ToBE TaxID=698762 RepID=A0A1W1VP24_9FIRM|nr:sugar-binding transcriptional regulator [Thermanaeromonas toyohensis]SMB95023.1 DNA-binding transcriptional regulator LsrR, DeoR family [Thermanaeromonas toyohensis ToBE]